MFFFECRSTLGTKRRKRQIICMSLFPIDLVPHSRLHTTALSSLNIWSCALVVHGIRHLLSPLFPPSKWDPNLRLFRSYDAAPSWHPGLPSLTFHLCEPEIEFGITGTIAVLSSWTRYRFAVGPEFKQQASCDTGEHLSLAPLGSMDLCAPFRRPYPRKGPDVRAFVLYA